MQENKTKTLKFLEGWDQVRHVTEFIVIEKVLWLFLSWIQMNMTVLIFSVHLG